MKKIATTWRPATEEEIAKGLSHPTNIGMIIDYEEEYEVPDEPENTEPLMNDSEF